MAATFLVQERLPLPLGTCVDNLYYMQGRMPYGREKVFPAPTFDLKINLGDPVVAFDSGDRSKETVCRNSWCMGVWTRHHVVQWPDQTHFIGVTFKPGGAYALLGIPLIEFHNQIVSLDAIWGPSAAAELRERLCEAPTPLRRLQLVAEILGTRLRDKRPPSDLVRCATERIGQENGALTIRALCIEVGVSQRYLSTLFRQFVGGSPKELARLSRFSAMLNTINAMNRGNLTSTAHSAQYFDQSHFCKEFKSFTGISPTDYLKRRSQVLVESPGHAGHVRLLAT